MMCAIFSWHTIKLAKTIKVTANKIQWNVSLEPFLELWPRSEKNSHFPGSLCKLRWSCFFSTPLGLQQPLWCCEFICPPCVFCHHSLECSWVRRARSLSLHLATQLNIGQRQPSGRGLFTKIHFDLLLRWRIVCCWRRRRGQAHTVHTRARASIQITHTAVWSPQRARSLI